MPSSGAARSVHEEFWSGGKLDDRPMLRGPPTRLGPRTACVSLPAPEHQWCMRQPLAFGPPDETLPFHELLNKHQPPAKCW